MFSREEDQNVYLAESKPLLSCSLLFLLLIFVFPLLSPFFVCLFSSRYRLFLVHFSFFVFASHFRLSSFISFLCLFVLFSLSSFPCSLYFFFYSFLISFLFFSFFSPFLIVFPLFLLSLFSLFSFPFSFFPLFLFLTIYLLS